MQLCKIVTRSYTSIALKKLNKAQTEINITAAFGLWCFFSHGLCYRGSFAPLKSLCLIIHKHIKLENCSSCCKISLKSIFTHLWSVLSAPVQKHTTHYRLLEFNTHLFTGIWWIPAPALQMVYQYVNSSREKWEVMLINCKLQYVMDHSKNSVVIKALAKMEKLPDHTFFSVGATSRNSCRKTVNLVNSPGKSL